MRRVGKSYVYFIAPDTSPPDRVKIGFTTGDPRARLSNLQTGSPERLRVLAYVEAEQFVEGLLHDEFAPLRLHGEWFSLDGKLLALVSWLFHQRQGRSASWLDEFQRAANNVLGEEEPPLGVFCTYDEWQASAVCGGLTDWLAERAWTEYQARKRAEGGE